MPYLYVETAKEKLCKGGRLLLGGLCNTTKLHHIPGASHDSSKTVRVMFPEESTDAVIYVTVVVVFYAAIILILVGTNIRRFRNGDSDGDAAKGQKRQLVAHIDHKERVYQQTSRDSDVDPGGSQTLI